MAERLHDLTRDASPGELEAVLRGLSAALWTNVDGASRSWRLPAGDEVDPTRGEGAAAVVSMVRDGYARQRALTELVRRRDPDPRVTTRAVALRTLDHVEPVRALALTYLDSLSGVDHLDAALGVLLAAARRRTASEVIGLVERTILEAPEPNLRGLRTSDDRAVRRWAWQATLGAGLATASDLEQAAETDPDVGLRRLAAGHLVADHPDVDAVPLMSSPSVELRVAALSRLTDADLSEARLRELLLDRAGRVREIARYRATRFGLDLPCVYRHVLDDPRASTRTVCGALEGLSLYGDESDLAAVTRLLTHPRPRSRAAAASAVASRAEPSVTTRVLLPVLADSSRRVAVTAALMIARSGEPPTIRADEAEGQPLEDELEAYWVSAQTWTRRAAWIAASSRGGWLQLLACLRVIHDEDPALAAEGLDRVRGWAAHASVTSRPAPAVAAALDENLRRAQERGLLDRRTADLIAFTGGLTRYPHPPHESEAAPQQRQPSGSATDRLFARLRQWRHR